MTHRRGTRDDSRDVNIDERLEALTQSLELLAHMQADSEARHDREMEDIRREARKMRVDFRRAFAMGVREARNARVRRQELEAKFDEKMTQVAASEAKLDEKMTQLAAAQLVTEEKLQRFIDTQARGSNENSKQ